MKSSIPLISIIIPVYNGSNYLREAIDSALAQTYKNIEIIVINDGSTDVGKTENIAKSYGNKIRYYVKRNGYVSSALNYGISKMKGEWFAWLSHDDYYLPDKAKIEAKFIKVNPDCRVFFCDTGVMDAQGKIIFEESHKYDGKIKGGIWVWKAWIYGCSILVHKSCFKEVGNFNERNRTTQDVEITLALLSKYEFSHISKVLVRRRDHIESDFHTLKVINSIDRDQLILRFLKTYGINYFYPGEPEAQSYTNFGKYLYVSNPTIADQCFKDSIKLWPSISNPAVYFSLVDMRIPRAIKLVYDFTVGSIKGLYKKIL